MMAEGSTGQLVVFTAALAALLVVVAWIDFRRMVIPDPLNLALGAAGLAFVLVVRPAEIGWQVAGSTLVAGSLFAVREAFLRLREMHALGLGDVKFAAAAGLWISPWLLPQFILIASVSALGYVVVASVATGTVRLGQRLPFGPFLALSTFTLFLIETILPHLEA
ncbi:A24 family peptidase [Aquibium sp. ELW1220]|uniref:prepilin peptidase n=1 Tax=Aquibium sp. ELW1220 TaxID=2976766 RepID=UPI0025B1E1DC|nr:A24 family peptidase [Aquibium sp. ELW1220]MDN2581677.1 A24 family peptidase [Aquibium sp. ELW1220]